MQNEAFKKKIENINAVNKAMDLDLDHATI